MSKTPNYDAKIKVILDGLKPAERVCAITGESWFMDEAEIDIYKKFHVPPGGLSPMSKRKRLAIFSTGFQFWWNKHFETGEPVLTFHHPASGVKVLPDEEWHTKDYSENNMEFTLERPFFDVLRELQQKVPYLATYNIEPPENSITLLSMGDQNSYFMLGCRSKNTFFATVAIDTEDSSQIMTSTNIQQSHYIGLCNNMYRCRYSFHSNDCMDSAFLNDCRNCKNCFGGSGLRNREYVFWNEQLTKEEYEAKMAEIDLGKRSEVDKWMKRFDEMCENEMFWPESFNFNCENSSGEYLNGSVNCIRHFYALPTAKDCTECAWTFGDVSDSAFLWGAANGSADQIETVTSARAQDLRYCMRCSDSRALEYCLQCINCEYCFGCVGLNRKKYCIFNKQYSEEEYWQKVDELKCAMLERGEYGEFFPAMMATAYQPEGGAIEYCVMEDEDLDQFGVNRFEANAENAAGMDGVDVDSLMKGSEMPDGIDEVGDDLLGKPFYDEKEKRKFALLKPELAHYRKHRIAPPTKHYVARMNEIVHSINSCIFTSSTCVKTGKEITVAKNRRWPNRKVLCMEEYLKYIAERN